MHHIYCISGLGADHRIFQKLKIENATLHFIKWELPGKNDDMRSYALKLAKQIKHPEIVLVGVSFGGMLSTEIAGFYKKAKQDESVILKSSLPWPVVIKKTILVSSCKSNIEFPSFMKLTARLGLHKTVPYKIVLQSNMLNRFLFDLKSEEEELYMKRLMLRENGVELIKRSVNIIMGWKNETYSELIHIHGTDDRLLTPANVKADYWISDGGHFMVWNRAKEVSKIINEVLSG